MIIGNYTDIVVIILYIFCDLKIDQLWIEYGCGKNRRWLPIHNYVKLLGEEITEHRHLVRLHRMRYCFVIFWKKKKDCMGCVELFH